MNAYLHARYQIVLQYIKRYPYKRKLKILDVGCGDGALTGLINRQGHPVWGIDVDKEGIRLAKEQFGIHGLEGVFSAIEGSEYPFGDGEFDIVICADVIEHVKEPGAVLTEIRRVLSPGGWAIITTPIAVSDMPLGAYHVQEWTPQTFEKFCLGVFDKIIDKKKTHPLLLYYLYTAKNRYIHKSARLIINCLVRLGFNLFLLRAPKGLLKAHMQTVVLGKS
ncbi:MAG: class I SAM-dependent methyltransferase [Candidatus Omnitrophica bacterium]|nr:class I SAM-dependent methyltransferase [Candidatus Omnitrophota bacterium]